MSKRLFLYACFSSILFSSTAFAKTPVFKLNGRKLGEAIGSNQFLTEKNTIVTLSAFPNGQCVTKMAPYFTSSDCSGKHYFTSYLSTLNPMVLVDEQSGSLQMLIYANGSKQLTLNSMFYNGRCFAITSILDVTEVIPNDPKITGVSEPCFEGVPKIELE